MELTDYLAKGAFGNYGLIPALMGVLLVQVFGTRADRLVSGLLKLTLPLAAAWLLVLAWGYLSYPNYIDHVEASVASLGLAFQQGMPLYPDPTVDPFRGLLYGPALAELQSVALSSGAPVIAASKLTGIIALTITAAFLVARYRENIDRGYLTLFLPFGIILFWNRPEPIFLLLVLSVIVLGDRPAHALSIFAIGLLAGVASAFKLHAALYVVAASLVMPLPVSWRGTLLFSSGCALALAGAFSPESVSIKGFASYISYAGQHGLSGKLLALNLAYAALLSAPVVYVAFKCRKHGAVPRATSARLAAMLAVELVVATVAAKPGAGIHHLLPFILINMQALRLFPISARSGSVASSRIVRGFLAGALCVTLVTTPMQLWALSDLFVSDRAKQAAAAVELEGVIGNYPAPLLGVSDNANYYLSFYRPILEILGSRQLDYAAFLDLSFAGLTDESLVRDLRLCRYGAIIMPNRGQPFAIRSSYTREPIFSDDTRRAFAQSYRRVRVGAFYTVFKCKSPTRPEAAGPSTLG